MGRRSLWDLDVLSVSAFGCYWTVQSIPRAAVLYLAKKRMSVCYRACRIANSPVSLSMTIDSAPAEDAREQAWHSRETVTEALTRDAKALTMLMSPRPESQHGPSSMEEVQNSNRSYLGVPSLGLNILVLIGRRGSWLWSCGLCCLQRSCQIWQWWHHNGRRRIRGTRSVETDLSLIDARRAAERLSWLIQPRASFACRVRRRSSVELVRVSATLDCGHPN